MHLYNRTSKFSKMICKKGEMTENPGQLHKNRLTYKWGGV